MSAKELMHIFDVERLTIYHWFNAWESRRFAGLYDHAGRGLGCLNRTLTVDRFLDSGC